MKKNTLFFLVCIFSCHLLSAQISQRGTPKSFYYTNLTIPSEEIPLQNINSNFIDVNELEIEDLKDEINGLPPRFAIPLDVQLNLKNSGIWNKLPNGDRLWRLKIISHKALSINLLYDDFFIPKGGELYIYDESKKQVIGAFTDRNNKPDNKFASGLVYGDTITLEYYEPLTVANKGRISIKNVMHGYRYIKVFGDSGNCHNNTVCDVATPWSEEIKSVALMLINGTRWCSGSLINNTAEDCTPLFLTADHCLNGFDAISNPSASTFTFYWNYESPGCQCGDGPINETTGGARVLANSGDAGNTSQYIQDSDFALLRLMENPIDAGYDVYFAGWDAQNNSFQSATGIHHPSGDVKKLSIANNISLGRYSSNNNLLMAHWQVNWNTGSTEGGSSGSPLFDNLTHNIIGDLSGGGAACGNNNSDFYGQLSYSWNNNGATTNTRRLRDWLDPVNNGNQLVMNGNANPCFSKFGNDITQTEGCVALPDGEGVAYTSTINFSEFPNNSQHSATNTITQVCVNMEHSWMRDLEIELVCPNGTRIVLHDHPGQTGGEVFLGVPDESDSGSNPNPGTGFTYCWTNNSSNGTWINYANLFNPGTLPAGDYASVDNFNNFNGCSLNGDWTLSVEDLWGIDNGFLFSWSISFDAPFTRNITSEFSTSNIPHGTYKAQSIVASSNINAGDYVKLDAGNSITLNAGFHAKMGSHFIAEIDPFGPTFTALKTPSVISENTLKKEEHKEKLFVYPNPTQGFVNINYNIETKQHVLLYLLDFSGKIIKYMDKGIMPQGKHNEVIAFDNNIPQGIYQILLKTDIGEIFTKKIVYQK